MPEDEELIERLRGGDETSLHDLLARHLAAVRAYVRLRMGPRVRRWETDSDIVQSVCVEVLSGLAEFEYRSESAFKQWLFQAALRKVVEKDRRLTAEKRDVGRMVSNAGDDVGRLIQDRLGTPSKVAAGNELMRCIEDAIDGMPARTREMVLLSRLAGLNSRAIAEQLGMSRVAVRKALSRGLTELAEAIGE